MQIVKTGIFPCNVLGFLKFGLKKVSLVWKEQLVKIRDEIKSPVLRGSLVMRPMTKFELAAPVNDHLPSLVIQMESNEWRDWETLDVVWAGRQPVSQAMWGKDHERSICSQVGLEGGRRQHGCEGKRWPGYRPC